MYKVPDEYFFRIHHIRPRFKNDIENVLIYMAEEIRKIGKLPKQEFKNKVNQAIRLYPGNVTKKIKTINNWRTEISSLFGLIELEGESCKSGGMSINLAENQDLVEFFKYFLYYFQYPGGHLKPHETLIFINKGIKFKPAQYLLKLLIEAESKTKSRFPINKAEATHCIFNDLRVTRNGRDIYEVLDLLLENRKKNISYDWTGDVIRYAGDILDYMVNANLLVMHGIRYYLNLHELESITAIIDSDTYFHDYDYLYKGFGSVQDVTSHKEAWFHYVNQKLTTAIFRTDVFKYLGIDETDYVQLAEQVIDGVKPGTYEIGDLGETLIHGHECMRVKLGNRKDLIHLIKRIPTALAVGYDIQSVELNELKRYVEVKTTISMKKLNFNRFHLTPNEWKTADSVKDRYFVYRLMVTKEKKILFLIQNPVGKYKTDKIKMVPRDGADITFSDDAGEYKELLIWES